MEGLWAHSTSIGRFLRAAMLARASQAEGKREVVNGDEGNISFRNRPSWGQLSLVLSGLTVWLELFRTKMSCAEVVCGGFGTDC